MNCQKITPVLTVVVTLMLVACCFAPAIYQSDDGRAAVGEGGGADEYKYVSVGDSMTAGFGLFDYYLDDGTNVNGLLRDIPESYYHKITEYLESGMGADSVEQIQLAMSGTRSVELRALLDDEFTGSDDQPGDADTISALLTSKRCLTTLAQAANHYPEIAEKHNVAVVEGKAVGSSSDEFAMLQEIYKMELTDADLVTISYHFDFASILASVLACKVLGYDTSPTYDFSLYADSPLAAHVEDISDFVFSKLAKTMLDAGIEADDTVSLAEELTNYFVYAIIGYCSNMDYISGWIYEHNPDAKIVVIETYHLFDKLDIAVNDRITIHIADIYNAIVDFCDSYIRNISPYSLKNYHVDVENAMLLGGEFKDLSGDKITDSAKAAVTYALFSNGLVSSSAVDFDTPTVPSTQTGLEAYHILDKNGKFTEFLKYVFSSNTFDFDSFLGGDVKALHADTISKTTTVIKGISSADNVFVYDEKTGSLTVIGPSDTTVFTMNELSYLYLRLFIAGSCMCHPSPYGCTEVANAAISAIEDQKVLDSRSKIEVIIEDGFSEINSRIETAAMTAITVVKELITTIADSFGLNVSIDEVYNMIHESIMSIGSSLQDLINSISEYISAIADNIINHITTK